NFQRSESSRQFNSIIPEREALRLGSLMYFDVFAFGHEWLARGGCIAQQQASAINRRVEPLMRIQRNGIGKLQSCEHRLVFFDHRSRSAICAVDVKPQ